MILQRDVLTLHLFPLHSQYRKCDQESLTLLSMLFVCSTLLLAQLFQSILYKLRLPICYVVFNFCPSKSNKIDVTHIGRKSYNSVTLVWLINLVLLFSGPTEFINLEKMFLSYTFIAVNTLISQKLSYRVLQNTLLEYSQL